MRFACLTAIALTLAACSSKSAVSDGGGDGSIIGGGATDSGSGGGSANGGSGGAGMGGSGGSGSGGSGSGGSGSGGSGGGSGGSGGAVGMFPIKVSANKRTLATQSGTPFMLVGDAAQALMVNLPESQADSYFASRAALGFNTVWSNLLVVMYTGGRADGTTQDGIAPFTTPGDLSTPNEAYFAHADRMLRAAAARGFVVLLDPAETGGWLSVLRSNGVTKARAYGRYVGARYASFDNIIWMSGNDFKTWMTAADEAVVKAVADGIRDMDTRHIQTVELGDPESDSVDDPTWASFIELNAAYTYYSIYDRLYGDYNRTATIPSFLVETNYETQNLYSAPHLTNGHDVRAQYYWSYLAGATGHVYGDQPVNHFETNWQTHLADPGAASTLHLTNLLGPRRWYDLVPDQTHAVVTAGYGTYSNAKVNNQDGTYAPTARTADGKLVLTYMPTARAITVDMTKLSGPATARWYDPTNGAFTAITGSPFANTGTHVFTPPTAGHADSTTDWVLVLEAS